MRQDYHFTPYIAELFNTLTNITYVALGFNGLANSRRLGESFGSKLPFIALINLGFASSLFHSSLKYPMQLADEFSMLIATFIVFYRLLCFAQQRFSPSFLFVGLCALMAVVVVAQVITGESTVQQIVFTFMVYWLWHICFKLIGKVDDLVLGRKMRLMAISGIALFISGHACWATDFHACNGLRQMRRTVGMPWAALLELHGWWHILTGIGVYIFMSLVECLRIAKSTKENDDLTVSSAGIWPFMVYLEKISSRDSRSKKMA
ncbi:alkaline phytoceramidase [Phlyctema vagabunda]|uniref:Alkaline phytoceramidase n=1 Tax=Phlyctema vagabunda TaxID=108571 RepID=A0ABR4PHM4_9HELO